MNIAFLVPEILNCGPLNVVLNIVKCLDKELFSLTLISIRKSNDVKYQNVFSRHLSNEIFYLDDYTSNREGLEIILFNHRIQVIHSHGYYPDKLVASLEIDNLKKISTIHCMFYKDYPKEYGFFKGFLGAYLHTNLLKKSDFHHIVGCSNSVANYCKDNLKLSKVLGINNGVDPNKYFIYRNLRN